MADPKETINIENVVASTGIGQELDLQSVAIDAQKAVQIDEAVGHIVWNDRIEIFAKEPRSIVGKVRRIIDVPSLVCGVDQLPGLGCQFNGFGLKVGFGLVLLFAGKLSTCKYEYECKG